MPNYKACLTHISGNFTMDRRCDNLELIIARATTSDDLPLDERYAWHLSSVISSPLAASTFLLSFTRRLGRARSWHAGLKCLLLLHRLLRILPADHPFHPVFLAARTNSLISFGPHAVPSHHCNLFLHSYACLLDDLLVSYPTDQQSKLDLDLDRALKLIPRLQDLLDRIMHCQPAGSAARSLIVRDALKQVVRDSFVFYSTIQGGLNAVLDALLDLPYSGCVAGMELYQRAAHQANRLSEFYNWARLAGLCGAYEYPLVEKIPRIQVKALRFLLDTTWCVTGHNSFMSPSSSSSVVTVTKENTLGELLDSNSKWEKFEEESESEDVDEHENDDDEAPLIKLVGGDDSSWEVLLEASVDRFRNFQSFRDEQMRPKISNQPFLCFWR